MIFYRPWRHRSRSAAAPAGSSSTCWRKRRTARCWPPRPAISRAIRAANTFSIGGWAEAYERAGGSYYPKLQVAVPFTPATGRRLLVRAGPDSRRGRPGACGWSRSNCARLGGASGVHVTFATEPEFRCLGELGYLQRTDQQFHWENPGFASFDDFLAALTARKRKTIRRERQDALANGDQRALAHRQRSHRRACGMRSSSSTWRPARANGAGPI